MKMVEWKKRISKNKFKSQSKGLLSHDYKSQM